MTMPNDQLEHLAELRKKNLEPVRHIGTATFTAFERIARKNHELMGDMLEHAVSQSRSQLVPGSPQERYARQLAEARAFAERVGMRVGEYAQIVRAMREDVAGDMSEARGSAAETADELASDLSAGTRATARKVSAQAAAAVPAAKKKSAGKKTASTTAASAEKAASGKKKAPSAKKKSVGKRSATAGTSEKKAGR